MNTQSHLIPSSNINYKQKTKNKTYQGQVIEWSPKAKRPYSQEPFMSLNRLSIAQQASLHAGLYHLLFVSPDDYYFM